jgi:hypothetical protein
MALREKSLFLYGFEVTSNNRSIDFKTASLGAEKQATLRLGYYSLTGLMTEVARAMVEADPANSFIVTADRTYAFGLENRVTISTGASFLSLLFGSGSRVSSSAASLIGFNAIDYTALTSYNGSFSAGTAVVPDWVGYNYLGPDFMRKNFGSVNISASGTKESITFSIQRFFQVEFKYEPQAKVVSQWANLMTWMIQQRAIEFTPEIGTPSLFYECTLEVTGDDGKGLGYSFKELLPQFPFYYTTGMLKFRQFVPPAGFL